MIELIRLRRNDISDQPDAARSLLDGHDGVRDLRQGRQRGLHFGRFRATTANAQLVVGAPAELQGAIQRRMDEIAGAVNAFAATGRIGDEAFCRGTRSPEVTPRHTRAAQIQLARAARGHRM